MYIKEHELKEHNLKLERISNNSFYEYHKDNKDHDIKAVISYYSYIAIIINDNIIINDSFYNYSFTTNRLIYDISSYKNIILVDHESFKKLLNYYRFNNTNDLYKSFFKLNDKKQLNLKIIECIERGGAAKDIFKIIHEYDKTLNFYSYCNNYKDIELKTRLKHYNYFKFNNLNISECITYKKNKKTNKELKRTLKLMNDLNYYTRDAGGVLSI